MTRFTKDQMLDELRTIFLFEADHIMLGSGDEIAKLVIGIPPDENREYCNQLPARVELYRFPISQAFERGYEFAFRPSVTNTIDEDDVQDLSVFMAGTPRAGGHLSGGASHTFMTPDGLCQTVADMVRARWRLEQDTAGSGTNTFTTRELALLADMTEGAVRNALADKSSNGLRAVSGSKNPVLVAHAEASRWLNGRKGFIPMPSHPRADRFLTERLEGVDNAEDLGELIKERLCATFGSISEAEKQMDWDSYNLLQWVTGFQEFTPEQAIRLADEVEFDIPTFVGKALEVTLRRDRFPRYGDHPSD